jgi:hypothetical protein
MNFKLYIDQNTIGEWQDFYINTDLLKTLMWPFHKFYKEHLLRLGVDPKPKRTKSLHLETNLRESLLSHEEHDISIQNNFAEQFLIELQKVEYFFNFNCQFYQTRIEKKKEQLEFLRDHPRGVGSNYDQLEKALKELYKEIHLMKSFIHLNMKIKSRILEKFKKYTRHLIHKIDLEDKVNVFVHSTSLGDAYHTINHFMTTIEHIFTVHFSFKYNHGVLKVLKEYVAPVYLTGTQSFYFGFFMGLTVNLLLLCWILCTNYNLDIDRDYEFKTIFPMFRGYILMCLVIWLLAVNVYAWEKANVNYKLCFQFNNHYSHLVSILIRVSILTAVGTLMILCYIILRIQTPIFYDLVNFVPINCTPLICWLVFLVYMMIPLRLFNYQGVIYVYRLISESILLRVDFKHLWFVSQLTSFVGPLRDIEYTVCYYSFYDLPSNEKDVLCSQNRTIVLVIGMIPGVLATLQCLKLILTTQAHPQIINMVKYFLSTLVILLSFIANIYPGFQILWLLTAAVSTVIATYWDLKYDFGFLEPGKSYPLREKLSYNNKFFYYFVLITNLFLRFMWVLSTSREMIYRFIRPEFFMLVIYSVEIIRRGMWNFIRVELQHIQLCKEFRVVNHVDLPLKKNKDGEFELNTDDEISIYQFNQTKVERRMNTIRRNIRENGKSNGETGVKDLALPGIRERCSLLSSYLVVYNKEVVRHLENIENETDCSFEVDEYMIR